VHPHPQTTHSHALEALPAPTSKRFLGCETVGVVLQSGANAGDTQHEISNQTKLAARIPVNLDEAMSGRVIAVFCWRALTKAVTPCQPQCVMPPGRATSDDSFPSILSVTVVVAQNNPAPGRRVGAAGGGGVEAPRAGTLRSSDASCSRSVQSDRCLTS